MDENNKSQLYIVGIVAIVAVVALVIMTLNKASVPTSAYSKTALAEDLSGDAKAFACYPALDSCTQSCHAGAPTDSYLESCQMRCLISYLHCSQGRFG
jgi:hypothetical protein